MVTALPLLAFCAYQLHPVYIWAKYRFPLTKEEFLYSGPRPFTQAQMLVCTINEKISSFLEKHKIRKDLIILLRKVENGAFGSNYFNCRPPVIFLNSSLFLKDQKASLWVLKHEIAHIKYNDILVTPLLMALVTLVVGVFAAFLLSFVLSPLLSSISASVLGIVCGECFKIGHSQYQESRADNFANATSTPEQLRGGLRFLKAAQHANLTLSQKHPQLNANISPSGENENDIYHPSLESRIAKIEAVLKEKNQPIEINPALQFSLNAWLVTHFEKSATLQKSQT